MSNIPIGYRLVITSWENDGDNYYDTVFEGLSKVDAEYLIALASLFKSMYIGDRTGFGGSAYHYELEKRGSGDFYRDIAEAMTAITAQHQEASEELRERFGIDTTADYWHDQVLGAASELVHYPSEDMPPDYIRVFEKFTVHDVKMEIQDVTASFKGEGRETGTS